MAETKLTTIEELLGNYKEKDVELSTGKKFTIQSFSPGNLMIDVGSPIVDRLTEANEASLRQLPIDIPQTNVGRVWTQFEEIVCDNVISVRFSRESQSILPTGLVSLKCLSLLEIQELYLAIRDLSISPEELETFRKVHQTDEDEPEREKVDSEDSKDSGKK